MASEKYDEACPKFLESYRLDRATGTLLNLAACHERQGKFASAWLEYSDGIVAARRDARADRVKFAEEHLADLEPKLSRVTLVVPPEADVVGLEVSLDGAPIGVAARGVPTPVDPGTHVVEAKAPGKQTYSQTLTIGALADRQTISIPKLEDVPTSVAPPLPQVAPAATVPAPVAPPPSPDTGVERPIPTTVYVFGATTLALGVAAGVTGVVYLNERASSKSAPVPSDAENHYDSARALGIANAGLWAATAVGAGLTAYFYFTRPQKPVTQGSAAHVAPWILPGSVGVVTRGAF